MLVYGITEDEARACAARVGLSIFSDWSGHGIGTKGRALTFRLGLGDDKEHYRKIGRGGRKISAVCWHGFRDYYREVFKVNPEARIKTALADYRGSEDFERTYRSTGSTNIGSLFEPLAIEDACACTHEIEFGTLEPSGLLTHVRHIQQASIAACPFVIFLPDHYRADGSCKCDDAEERARLIRDAGYTASDFESIPLREVA